MKEFKNVVKDLMGKPIPEEEKNLIPEGHIIKASFFRNTFFEKLADIPYIGGYIGKYLNKIDTTLFDFKIVYNPDTNKGILVKLDIKKRNSADSKMINKFNNESIPAYKLEGEKFGCFIGYALMNISKINLMVISALQVPIIYKAFTDRETKENKLVHGIKQIFKSIITVPLAVLGGAMLGTLFHRKGAASTMLATGVGAYMGAKAGEYLEEKIDKI